MLFEFTGTSSILSLKYTVTCLTRVRILLLVSLTIRARTEWPILSAELQSLTEDMAERVVWLATRTTTRIQSRWLDPSSRCQNVYAAPSQGKGKLQKITAVCNKASKIRFYCEVALCILKTKDRRKSCLAIRVKGKVFPQQAGRCRKHCVKSSDSIPPPARALSQVSAGRGRVTAFPAVHTKGHFAPVPSEWKFALCKSSSSPQRWRRGGGAGRAQAHSGWNQRAAEEEGGWQAGPLQSGFISFNV